MQYAVVQHPATILKRWETHWRRSKSGPGEGLDGPGTRPDPTRPDPRPLFEASTSTSTARIIHPSDPSRKRGTGNEEHPLLLLLGMRRDGCARVARKTGESSPVGDQRLMLLTMSW